MADPRTFTLSSPLMRGDDVRAWRKTLRDKFAFWGVDYPLEMGQVYDIATRAATATILHGMGIAQAEMEHGVTPELRTKIRNARLTPAERERYAQRAGWRDALVHKFEAGGVAAPVNKIITHANGWSGPNGHDGVDLICPEDAPLYAMCRCKVVRVSASGWWGSNPTASPGHPISDGDGIVSIQALVSVGPIKKGWIFGYGHAEHAKVKVGQIVVAGQVIALAGFARAPHPHLMLNSGAARFWRGDFARGVGSMDPWPIVAYCIAHS